MTKIVFMGTPHFAAVVLTRLLKETEYEVAAVVTQPDRPVGRKRIMQPSAVKQVAIENDIAVLQPLKLSGSDEMEQIIAMQPDIIITAAYGQFLPQRLLAAAKIAAINVHGSLLPKYRGGAPIQYAIKNGDRKTGITIMYMIKQMDAGDIISQAELPILPTDDAGSIFEKLSELGANLLVKTLPNIIAGMIHPVSQNPAEVVFAPTIKPAEEKLLLTQTATQIDCQVRALRPQPGAYFKNFKNKRTKLWDVTPLDETTDLPAGSVVAKQKHVLKIAAAAGSVYTINVLQVAGKPKQNISDYLNGAGQNLTEGQKIIEDDE